MSDSEEFRTRRIAPAYAEAIADADLDDLDDERARAAAARLTVFGDEVVDYLARRFRTAEPEELRKALRVIRFMDRPEIGEHMAIVTVDRVVPLDLKVAFFEAMAEMGCSIDKTFLQHMQEADELYHQLNSHLRAGDEQALERAATLVEEFALLPENLKLSFLQELGEQWGAQATPWLTRLAGRDAGMAPVVIDMISRHPGADTAQALSRLAEAGGDKETIKRARRALYILKEKGFDIAPEAAAPREEAAIERDDAGEEAYSTTLDSFGARMVILAAPALSRMLVLRASVDDAHGLLRFTGGEMSRKIFRGYLKDVREQMREQRGSGLVKIDPDHCRWIVQRAYDLNAESGSLVPEAFKQFRYRIRAPEGYDPETRFGSVQPDENDERWAANHPEELFDIPELSIWMIEREQLLPYARRYVEMAESKLVLDEAQRRARLNDIVSDFAEEYFDAGRTARLCGRIRETAYLAARQDRAEDARRLLALAKGIGGSSKLNMHGFLTTYMLRSVVGAIQAFAQEDERRRAVAESGQSS